MQTYQAAPGIDVITSSFPVPGLGQIPINAFVVHGKEPILVDTGPIVQREAFMTALRSVIDPAALRWLWLTHPDADHIGALAQLLEECPRLRVITTFLGVGILSLSSPLPLDRVHLLNPGETLTLPDRALTAVRPPAFDSPATTGFFDDRTRALFSSDCFGALLEQPPQRASDLSERALHDGQLLWATVDAPWLHRVDRGAFARSLDTFRGLAPSSVLSSHLPAADGSMLERLLATLAEAPDASPFVGPNQPALEQMLKQLAGPPAA